MRRVQIDVLGPVRVRRDGSEVDLGTPRQRAIVAALALEEGRVLSVPAVVRRVWGEQAPATVQGTLQSYIGQLRRALEPDRGPRRPATVLVTEHGGYALRVPREGRDDAALADAVGEARTLLSPVADPLRPQAPLAAVADVARAAAVLDRALAGWRGEPYADLGEDPDAAAERTRLADRRTSAQELSVVARLALGQHAEVAAEVEAMTRSHPLHERWWTLWALALARSGRQADALAALHRLRSVLDDELGVEPSGPVRDLQTAILRQDPSVTWQAPAAPAPAATPAGAGTELDRDVPGSARTVPARVAPRAPAWPLVGRTVELGHLTTALDEADAGRFRPAWVSGEAGIGKSRLVQELASTAFERGFTVAVGACGQAGAPALWPSRRVLASLQEQGVDLGGPTALDALLAADPGGFATWDGLARPLVSAAEHRPVLVVLEDVHDADLPSLRLLGHLVDLAAATGGTRLLLVATRRSGAGDDGVLTPLAAVVARQGGVRADLDGLDAADADRLLDAATGTRLPSGKVAELTDRSGGNPFFLVELARAGGAVSGSLTDVVAGRLADLPEETRDALAAAAVVGTEFDATLVALALDLSPSTLAVRLEPAVAAGMLRRPAATSRDLQFAHAVVRDVVAAGLAPGERAAAHARTALALGAHSGLRRVEHRADLARHWEAAGTEHVGTAWRALLRAAEQATLDSAHTEAAGLLSRAVGLQEQDAASDERARYALLMLLVDAQRWAGQWTELGRTVDAAVATAERIGDAELAARAAMATIEGAIWQVRTFGVVHAPIVAALERAISRLDLAEGPVGLRARARIALATELYYSDDRARLDTLVEEAVALADGSGDLRLRSVVLSGAFSARWRSDTLAWRREIAERAAAVAVELGDARAQVLAQTLVTGAALEQGDLAVVRSLLPRTVSLARHLGLVGAEAILHVAHVPLLAMAGEDDAAQAALARAAELATRSHVPNFDRAVGGTAALAALWAGDLETLAGLSGQMASAGDDAEGVSMQHVAPWMMVRTGMADLARALFPDPHVDLSDASYTFLANACLACEMGLGLGTPDLAARGYAAAAPYAGRMASGGSAMAIGPVDGYLALGAVAAGDLARASAHADAAIRLGRAWGLPRYVDWVVALRETHAL